MKKFGSLIALALSASSVMGTCEQNWITTEFGINLNQSPVLGDNTFLTCATIRSGQSSCCTSAEVGTFQDKADDLVEELEAAVAVRDQFIVDRRDDVIAMKTTLDSIQSSFAALDPQSNFHKVFLLKMFADAIGVFNQHFSTLLDDFATYQESRATCFDMLTKAQVSIWCSACLEDPSINGLNVATHWVEYGSTFKDALASACSGYLDDAVLQNSIVFLDFFNTLLPTVDSLLKKANDGDNSGATQDLIKLVNDFSTLPAPTNALEAPPTGSIGTCTTTSCSWITDKLFVSGILNTDRAVVAGTVGIDFSRRLQAVDDGRMLQSQNLNVEPEVEAAGIIVNFPENPGNVDNI